MDNLTMDLVLMTRHNRDGAYGTQKNRQRGLIAIGRQLKELGYVLPKARSLKTKHVQALLEHWQCRELDTATIRNRLTWLRWWAERIDKPNIIERDNAVYGLAERHQPRNRAQRLEPAKLANINCPYIRTSLLLQAAFGLRREEAMKFQPGYAIQLNSIVLRASWSKGGRPRQIPITTGRQRAALAEVRKLIPGDGSLIPPRLTYAEQLKRYEYQTLLAGLRNTHGLRHAYAQQRYLALTGWPCPLAGGKHWRQLTDNQRQQDRHARLAIARELGHGRVSIAEVYLGRAGA